jgi:phosphotransferase system enzyme I (PtsI)
MGLTDFSMKPSSLLPARGILRNLRKGDLAEAALKALSLGTAEEVEEYCSRLLQTLNLCR